MKRNALFTISTSFFLLSFVSCDFGNMNIDKYNPPYNSTGGEIEVEIDKSSKYADIDINYKLADGDLSNYQESTIGSLFANMTYEGCYNDYQRTTNLTHDIYCGYVANNKPDFNSNSPSYSYTDGWSALRWNFFYTNRTVGEYAQLLKIFYFNDYKKYKNAFYITRIYWAFLASMNTDTYGDMPMADYVRGRSIANPDSVRYDKQADVYDIIFRLLEQATDSIVPGLCPFMFDEQDDKCFGGDESKWLRFANTLRLRLALRIANVDPARAKQEGEAAMANKWGLMRNNEDRMRTVPKHAPVALGGIDDGGNENVLAMCSFAYNGDCVLSKDLELAYKEQSVDGATYTVGFRGNEVSKRIDPRCIVCWWRPNDMNELKLGNESVQNIDYNGCEIGNTDVKHTETVKIYSVTKTDIVNSKILNPTKYFSYSRESVWLSYAEMQFLLAEAALRGWAGASGTPQAYFEEGIRASMNYFEISGAETEAYISGLKIYQPENVNPFATGEKEGMLEQIITQKWLTVFPNGNEGWAEFRRTDYPRLRNSLNNTSGGDVPDGKFIKRILYPYGAKNNVFKPSSSDSQGKRLWWDVADTNDGAGNRMKPNNFR